MKPIIRHYDVVVYSKTSNEFDSWCMGITLPILKRFLLRKKKEYGSIRFYYSIHEHKGRE